MKTNKLAATIREYTGTAEGTERTETMMESGRIVAVNSVTDTVSLSDNYLEKSDTETLKKDDRNILMVVSHILGFFYSTDIQGFNLLHAVLYAYKFLRQVKGGPRAKPELPDNRSKHDPRERKIIHGSGGYGRTTDENDILDIVQSAFLIFFLSKRGKKGDKPENIDTATACGRAFSKWMKKEDKNRNIRMRIAENWEAIFRQESKKDIADSFCEILPAEVNRKQLKTVIDGILAGKKQRELATDMGCTQQYISKLLKKVKAFRHATRAYQEQKTTEVRHTVPSIARNETTGQFRVQVATTRGTSNLVGMNPEYPMGTDDTFYYSGTLPNRECKIDGPDCAGPLTIIPETTAVPYNRPADPVKLQSRYFYCGCPAFVPLTYEDGSRSVNGQWEGMPDNAEGAGI